MTSISFKSFSHCEGGDTISRHEFLINATGFLSACLVRHVTSVANLVLKIIKKCQWLATGNT